MQTRFNVRNSIKIGYRMNHQQIYVQSNGSKLVHEVLNLLTSEGFIEGQYYDKNRRHTHSKVFRRYTDGVGAVKTVQPASHGLNHLRISQEDLYSLHNGLGIYVLSTDQGVKTDQQARAERLGGVILFTII